MNTPEKDSAADEKIVEIRINGVAGTTRYKGNNKMTPMAFLKSKHIAVVLADVNNPKIQLWYGGVCISCHETIFLEEGDTIRCDVDITSVQPEKEGEDDATE